MSVVIKVENVSKKFRLQQKNAADGTLRDLLGGILRPKRAESSKDISAETLWALRDINFEVQAGDTLGIVGKNGAGKSTLLKVLSRITRPTRGKIEMFGRVGSLLEVGTGFHQDLSGRENIFLNGAILGMKRREIEKKFDEIVAFAEVEKFIETPVKRYSSGMYMRLAFAVAAHLEPEILIVDEVLAVGDAAFQKKCLGKMNEVAGEGRTILFVSHNAGALERLCKTGIYLEGGKLKDFGAMKNILAQYQNDSTDMNSRDAQTRLNPDLINSGEVRFTQWHLINSSAGLPHSIFSRETAEFDLTLYSKRDTTEVFFKIILQDAKGENVLIAHNLSGGIGSLTLKRGLYQIGWKFAVPLRAGNYKVYCEVYSAETGAILDLWESPNALTVFPVLEYDLPDDFQSLVNVPVEFRFSEGEKSA